MLTANTDEAVTMSPFSVVELAPFRRTEADRKTQLGVQRWVRDLPYRDALERLANQPTVNIEGMYAGYTGPGGKTILPSKAVAKLDLRLVPDQTAEEAARKLKAHLGKRGYGDIRVDVTGGYDPTQTEKSSALIKSMEAVYRAEGVPYAFSPRLAGSWAGYGRTGEPARGPLRPGPPEPAQLHRRHARLRGDAVRPGADLRARFSRPPKAGRCQRS